MKTALYDVKGTKKSDIELPALFETALREDLVLKYVEAEKFQDMQPYATYEEAGKRHSASGTISHRRHEWKGHYGKGISRIPRKSMWRRGTQFYWVGAEVASTRGGRRAHPPQGINRPRKINRKEMKLAFYSALAATLQKQAILNRYSSLKEVKNTSAVIESLPQKAKDFSNTVNNIFSGLAAITLKTREVRAGRGKLRGRKYKSNAGLLVLTSKAEKAKFTGVEIKSVSELKISDLYPLGRMTLYTQKALEELTHVA